MIYLCAEVNEGSLGEFDVVTTPQEAIDWGNKILKEYDWDLDGFSRRPKLTLKNLENEDINIELPGDEMRQSNLHIKSRDWD